MVDEAQLERVHLQRVGQLVHGALQRVHARCLAGGAHRRRRVDVHRRQVVARRHVGAGVEESRRVEGALGVLLEGRGLGRRLVADGRQLAVLRRAQRHLLDGARPVAGDRVLLGARQDQLDGAADVPGGQRRDEDVDPRPQRRAERAADERRHDAHVALVDAERGGHLLLHVIDPLRLIVEGELVAVPGGDGGVQLHRVVVLVGVRVGLFDLHRGAVESLVRLAALVVGRLLGDAVGLHLVRREPLGRGVREIEDGLRLVVGRADERGGVRGALERVGHHDGDGLAVVVHLIVLERLERAADLGVHQRLGLLRQHHLAGVAVRDDRQHAGGLLGRGGVDLRDPPLGDGAEDEDAVGHVLDLELGGVARAARHLEPAVHAAHRRSDRLLRLGHDSPLSRHSLAVRGVRPSPCSPPSSAPAR